MAHEGRDAPGEVERRFGDRKGVAGVEADSDAARRLAEGASSSLPKSWWFSIASVVPSSAARGPRSASAAPHLGDQLRPLRAERVRGRRTERSSGRSGSSRASRSLRRTQRAFERAHHQARADDRRHAERRSRSRSAAKVVVAERPKPGIEDLKCLRAEFARDRDETFEARAARIGARPARALQAEMVGQAVGVEADRERSPRRAASSVSALIVEAPRRR